MVLSSLFEITSEIWATVVSDAFADEFQKASNVCPNPSHLPSDLVCDEVLDLVSGVAPHRDAGHCDVLQSQQAEPVHGHVLADAGRRSSR